MIAPGHGHDDDSLPTDPTIPLKYVGAVIDLLVLQCECPAEFVARAEAIRDNEWADIKRLEAAAGNPLAASRDWARTLDESRSVVARLCAASVEVKRMDLRNWDMHQSRAGRVLYSEDSPEYALDFARAYLDGDWINAAGILGRQPPMPPGFGTLDEMQPTDAPSGTCRQGQSPAEPAKGGFPDGKQGLPGERRPVRGTFRRTGDSWLVGFEKSAIIKHVVGMSHLHYLLARPGENVKCATLVVNSTGVPVEHAPVAEIADLLHNDAISAEEAAHELSDARTIRQVESVVKLLENELKRGLGPDDYTAKAETLKKCKSYLSAVQNMRRTKRKTGGTRNKHQGRVVKAIGRAIDSIGRHSPDVHEHLKRCISRADECSYRPDDPNCVWDLGMPT